MKVYVRDFLSEADFQRLSPPLSAIRKLGHVETNSDGLLDFRHAGLNIAVSPDQFVRGIEIYDAVLKAATTQGWTVKQAEKTPLRIVVDGEPLELAVAERTEPILGSPTSVGARAPRRPTGTLSVALSAGERKVYVSDKRGRRIESKLPSLFAKAETLASEIRAEHERQAALRREHEMELRRRYEVHERIEQLKQDVALWQEAKSIRTYTDAVAERLAQDGPVTHDTDAAKWLEWARRYADSIDPTCGRIKISQQEFWD